MYLEAPYSGRFGKPTNDKLCPSGLTSCSPSCCSGVARLILDPLSQQPDRDHGDTAGWQYNPLWVTSWLGWPTNGLTTCRTWEFDPWRNVAGFYPWGAPGFIPWVVVAVGPLGPEGRVGHWWRDLPPAGPAQGQWLWELSGQSFLGYSLPLGEGHGQEIGLFLSSSWHSFQED